MVRLNDNRATQMDQMLTPFLVRVRAKHETLVAFLAVRASEIMAFSLKLRIVCLHSKKLHMRVAF